MGVGEDPEGKLGVFLQKTVTGVAMRALSKHLHKLGPRVLPVLEQVRCHVQRLQSLLRSHSPQFDLAEFLLAPIV